MRADSLVCMDGASVAERSFANDPTAETKGRPGVTRIRSNPIRAIDPCFLVDTRLSLPGLGSARTAGSIVLWRLRHEIDVSQLFGHCYCSRSEHKPLRSDANNIGFACHDVVKPVVS